MKRRAILTAAAWSVPAVAIAATAPAYASSEAPKPCQVFGHREKETTGHGRHKVTRWIYYVDVTCAEKARHVVILGLAAKRIRPDATAWAVVLPTKHDRLPVQVLSHHGIEFAQVVTFR